MPDFSITSILPFSSPIIQVCDIGAAEMGEGNRYDSLMEQGLAFVTGFEPFTAQCQYLEGRAGGKGRFLPYVLGTGEKATFHFTRYLGCSSLYEPNPDIINLFTAIGTTPDGWNNFAVQGTTDVDTIRLDDVPDVPLLDYMKLDVQGAELDVLRHGMHVLRSVLVLEVEVEFVEVYQNQPLFGDVHAFLVSQGFTLHKFQDMAGRTFRPWRDDNNPTRGLSQILWADAIFVRDITRIDDLDDGQLVKSAVILHELYDSYDLVLTLLAHFDRRNGTRIHEAYMDAIKSAPQIQPNFALLRHPKQK